MKYRTLFAIFAIGLCAGQLSAEDQAYAQISFLGPSSKSKAPVDRNSYVLLVVEGPFISFDRTPIPNAGLVDYVNQLLKEKNVTYLAIYIREGVKYGDVVRSLDILRLSNAKNIGVSMVEVPAGRDP